MLYIQLHQGELSHPISTLEEYFRRGGVTIIQAAFAHSYFIHPDSVREKTPDFPERARFSRQNYPGAIKGQKQSGLETDERSSLTTTNMPSWHGGRYTGHGLARGTGVLDPPHLGTSMGSGRFHGRVEPMLHALLGPDADRGAESARGTGTGCSPGLLGPLLSG